MSDERVHGVVASFSKGFGFIQVGDKLVVGEDKPEEVFVFHNDIVMAAYEPAGLRRGMHVTFTKTESTTGKNKGKTHATDVKNLNEEPISWFDKHGDDDRDIFDGKTFTGLVGDYDRDNKSGYLLLNEKISAPNGEKLNLLTRLNARKLDFILEKNNDKGIFTGREVMFKLMRYNERFGATYITDLKGKPLKEVKREGKRKNYIDVKDTTTRHTGRVLKFSSNNHGFILPSDDMSEYNIDRKLWFKAEDINTAMRPARVAAGMDVSFTIERDGKTVKAVDVSLPNGKPIVMPKGYESKTYEEQMPREKVNNEELEGTVVNYFWDKGFGHIKINNFKDADIPADVKNQLKEGQVYFRWSDIKSDDKTVGIELKEKVKFNLYKDKRGVGAENITDSSGNAITDADRKKATKQRRKTWGKTRRWNNNKGGNWNNRGNNRGWNNKRKGNWNNKSWGNKSWGNNQGWKKNNQGGWKRKGQWNNKGQSWGNKRRNTRGGDLERAMDLVLGMYGI